MHTEITYDYAVLRVTPQVEREEFLNAGVVLFCLQRRFLACTLHLDAERLRRMWPLADVGAVERHLWAARRICEGDVAAGPVARLSQRERFHWLTAPRSAVLQTSPVRTGVCTGETDLDERLESIARSLVHLQGQETPLR